jgi:hypothetical protein
MTCRGFQVLAGVSPHKSPHERARWAYLCAVLALAWIVSPQTAHAQSVEAQTEAEREAGEPYFHEAAQFYVAKQKRQALRVISDGLDVAPNHPKLLALKNKLENQPGARPDQNPGESDTEGPESQEDAEPQEGENGQEEEGDAPQQGNRQPSPGRAGESGQQGPPRPPEQNDNSGEQEGDGQQQRPGEDGEQSPNGQSGGNESLGTPSGESTERLSREQAERILQALEGQEKQLLREVQKREARPRRVEKDW